MANLFTTQPPYVDLMSLSTGGLWHYTDDPQDGQACVMKSTVINTSKEMMCYSDFPIPREFPVFMHNKYVLRYFNLYAENFNLTQHINFQTEVSLLISNFNWHWVRTVKRWKNVKILIKVNFFKY